MFDLGALELIVIGIVALIVVGPKDLPGMFRTVGRFMGKARAMAREFQRSMEEAADESGLRDATKGLQDLNRPFSAAKRSAKSYAKSVVDDEDDDASAATAKPAPKPKPATGGAVRAEATTASEAAESAPAAPEAPADETPEPPAEKKASNG